jgi:hypothetical protein
MADLPEEDAAADIVEDARPELLLSDLGEALLQIEVDTGPRLLLGESPEALDVVALLVGASHLATDLLGEVEQRGGAMVRHPEELVAPRDPARHGLASRPALRHLAIFRPGASSTGQTGGS